MQNLLWQYSAGKVLVFAGKERGGTPGDCIKVKERGIFPDALFGEVDDEPVRAPRGGGFFY